MRVMVRFTLLAATAAFVLALYSTATGRDVMEIVERARRATAQGNDMRATVELELVNARGESVRWTASHDAGLGGAAACVTAPRADARGRVAQPHGPPDRRLVPIRREARIG